MDDAELVQRGYDVTVSCKTAEQIEISGAYLALISRRLQTEEGHRDFMLMLDRLIDTVQKKARS